MHNIAQQQSSNIIKNHQKSTISCRVAKAVDQVKASCVNYLISDQDVALTLKQGFGKQTVFCQLILGRIEEARQQRCCQWWHSLLGPNSADAERSLNLRIGQSAAQHKPQLAEPELRILGKLSASALVMTPAQLVCFV